MPRPLFIRISLTALLAAFLLAACAGGHIRKGDRYFDALAYEDAVRHYEKGLKKRKDPDAQLRLAEAYKELRKFPLAEDAYFDADAQRSLPDSALLDFAGVLMSNKSFDEAGRIIRRYIRNNPNDKRGLALEASIKEMAILTRDSMLYKVWELPLPVNSEKGSTFSPRYFEDGLIICAERGDEVLKDKNPWTGNAFLDLYYTETDDSVVWERPQKLKGKINSRFHEGPVAWIPDSSMMFFTRSNFMDGDIGVDDGRFNNLKIFISRWEDDKWSEPEDFVHNSDDYSVAHPAISTDGKWLYFVSDMPGGHGGSDLYRAYIGENGIGAPQNLGPSINSAGDELFPWIANDGTLYYSSNGRGGMGGLDIFRSYATRRGGFEDPENMLYPLNSPGDDFGYITRNSGKNGFLSSNRGSEDGVDRIYEFYRIDPVLVLKGETWDKRIRRMIDSVDVTLVDDRTGDTLRAVSWNGQFTFRLEQDKDYRVVGRKEGLIPDSTRLSTRGEKYDKTFFVKLELESRPPAVRLIAIDADTRKHLPGVALQSINLTRDDTTAYDLGQDASMTFKPDSSSLYDYRARKRGYFTSYTRFDTQHYTFLRDTTIYLIMKKVPFNIPFVLKDIYYDFDSHILRKESYPELNKLASLLMDNPTIRIELSSHTDARGSDAYNLRLSRRRANSARLYLLQHGIPHYRIIPAGYGETRHVNHCSNGVWCSEPDHQLNRRTEFVMDLLMPDEIPDEDKEKAPEPEEENEE